MRIAITTRDEAEAQNKKLDQDINSFARSVTVIEGGKATAGRARLETGKSFVLESKQTAA